MSDDTAMSGSLLTRLADSAGIVSQWTDANGQPQTVSPEVQRRLLESMGYRIDSDAQMHESLQELNSADPQRVLPRLITGDADQPVHLGNTVQAGTAFRITMAAAETVGEPFDELIEGTLDEGLAVPPLRPGYHLLEINHRQHTLAIAPAACPDLDQLSGQRNARLWGLTAQLYSLRRPHAHGVGDTGALEDLAKNAAAHGADALAISPVHAVSTAGFDHFSPYSPSSRLFFNILHAAPDLVLGSDALDAAIEQCQFGETLQQLESLELVDWHAVHETRLALLRQLYRNFIAGPHPLVADFQQFVHDGGVALEDHCRFEALHDYQLSLNQSGDWRSWPEALQDHKGPAVAAFATEHGEAIAFHRFCQWLTARSLQHAQSSAREAGMRIGLISDLAVGASLGGSQTWTRKEEFLSGVGVGAPPDVINAHGQNWQLAAFSPRGLQEHGFRAYIEMLRANLACCGGIRIDHVMGLERLWLIPDGASADQGAYVKYPFQDMLRLLILEAWRHKALVIGEDLGTVREGLREELAQRNVLGMRVLFFEQQGQQFKPAQQWDSGAMATTTTHDLPTLKGWFAGRDIHWRSKSGYATPDQTEADYEQRQQEASALVDCLQQQGYLGNMHSSEARLEASLNFVAATPARLVMIPLEDIMASEEQPNLPGPGHTHPNWRRRWPINAGHMFDSEKVRSRAQRLTALRAESREACDD